MDLHSIGNLILIGIAGGSMFCLTQDAWKNGGSLAKTLCVLGDLFVLVWWLVTIITW